MRDTIGMRVASQLLSGPSRGDISSFFLSSPTVRFWHGSLPNNSPYFSLTCPHRQQHLFPSFTLRRALRDTTGNTRPDSCYTCRRIWDCHVCVPVQVMYIYIYCLLYGWQCGNKRRAREPRIPKLKSVRRSFSLPVLAFIMTRSAPHNTFSCTHTRPQFFFFFSAC